jgi:hypothetical protein
VAVEPVVRVARERVRIVAAKVVAGAGVLIKKKKKKKKWGQRRQRKWKLQRISQQEISLEFEVGISLLRRNRRIEKSVLMQSTTLGRLRYIPEDHKPNHKHEIAWLQYAFRVLEDGFESYFMLAVWFIVDYSATHVVVDEIRVHVVDAVVHDGRRDVLAGDALGPRGLNVQVEPWLSTILASVFLKTGTKFMTLFFLQHKMAKVSYQVPLVLEQWIGGIRLWRDVDQVLDLERVVASLVRPETLWVWSTDNADRHSPKRCLNA